MHMHSCGDTNMHMHSCGDLSLPLVAAYCWTSSSKEKGAIRAAIQMADAYMYHSSGHGIFMGIQRMDTISNFLWQLQYEMTYG